MFWSKTCKFVFAVTIRYNPSYFWDAVGRCRPSHFLTTIPTRRSAGRPKGPETAGASRFPGRTSWRPGRTRSIEPLVGARGVSKGPGGWLVGAARVPGAGHRPGVCVRRPAPRAAPPSHQLPPPRSRVGHQDGRQRVAETGIEFPLSAYVLNMRKSIRSSLVAHPLSLQPGPPPATRARTYYAFVPPRLRELRDRRGALLPSPRWRARHGQPVASPFRDAGLRAPPPCIIRKRVASEAAAFSRAPLSLA